MSNVRVHPTAIVEPESSIGDDTAVWHHVHVRASASVGVACVLGKNVYVDTGVSIGDRCKLQNNVSVFHGVTIANDVFVGPSATFTNDRVPRAFNENWETVTTEVRTGASIGANATIVCGVVIGEYAMVGAGSVVVKDVTAYELVAGNPARHLGWVCRCGNVVSRSAESPRELSCPRCTEEKL